MVELTRNLKNIDLFVCSSKYTNTFRGNEASSELRRLDPTRIYEDQTKWFFKLSFKSVFVDSRQGAE